MENIKRQWLPRVLIGGCAGIAAHAALGCLLGWAASFDPSGFTGLHFPDCGFSSWDVHLGWVGILLSFALSALFGAEVGIATLPFADSGRQLAARSLIHFTATASTAVVWCGLNFGWGGIPLYLLLLAAGYALIWLTRWVGWYAQLADIRERLGLTPAPSPLKWREVLPYLLLLGLVYGLAMPLLGIFDGPIPFLTGFLLPYIVYPILAGAVGFHTGKHHGFTILVPLAVYLLALLNDFWLFLAKVLGIANMAYGYLVLGLAYAAIASACHGMGIMARAARHKMNRKAGGAL